MGFDARWADLSISEPDTCIGFTEDDTKKEKHPVDCNCIDKKMPYWLPEKGRQTACWQQGKVAQISICHKQGLQNLSLPPTLIKMGNIRRTLNGVLSAKNKKPRPQFTESQQN